MDFSRNKLFSGARLTEDQDRGVCSCYYLNLADDSPAGCALTDDFAKCPIPFPISVVSPDCVSDCLQQIFVVKRLGQKVYRTSLDRLDRHRDVTMTSEKDNRDSYVFPR